jgi:hypothetical protein
MNDAMKPSPALLAKLVSLIFHQEEFMETANLFDREAAESIRQHPDIREWIMNMQKLGLTPVKRHG